MGGLDYAVAGLLGGGQGFLQNQQNENKEAKLQKEVQRQAALLQAKEERIAAREMAKTKADQDFQMKKQRGQQDFDLKKQSGDQAFDLERDKAKREATLSDTEMDQNFKMKELGVKHKNDLELEGMKKNRTGNDTAKKARDTLRDRYVKAKSAQGEFGDELPDFDTWASENFPELYEEADLKERPANTVQTSKFQSIFDNVASRTKKGANDTPEKLPSFVDNKRTN